jgi:hypothetical protein
MASFRKRLEDCRDASHIQGLIIPHDCPFIFWIVEVGRFVQNMSARGKHSESMREPWRHPENPPISTRQCAEFGAGRWVGRR